MKEGVHSYILGPIKRKHTKKESMKKRGGFWRKAGAVGKKDVGDALAAIKLIING